MGTIVFGVAFASGCYVGWKTTMKVMDHVLTKRKAMS
jgi:hypothetical protein